MFQLEFCFVRFNCIYCLVVILVYKLIKLNENNHNLFFDTKTRFTIFIYFFYEFS